MEKKFLGNVEVSDSSNYYSNGSIQGGAWSEPLDLKIYFLAHIKHVNIGLCLSAKKEMADDGPRMYCTAIKIIHYNIRQSSERLKMIS